MTTMKPAFRRYLTHLSIAFAAYFIILMGMNTVLDHYSVPFALSVLLVLLPMIPVIFVIRIIIQYVRSWDELQQRQYLEAAMTAFALVASGTFAWGFLEDIGFPALPTMWIMPMMMVTLALSQWFVCRRYH